MRVCSGGGKTWYAGALLATLLGAGCGGGGGAAAGGSGYGAVLFSDAAVGNMYSFSAAGSTFRSTVILPVGGKNYNNSGAGWAQVSGVEYFLNGAGNWQDTNSAALVDNGDDSVTFGGLVKYTISSISDLSGQSASCINSVGVSSTCPSPKTYAAGARRFSGTQTLTMDWYGLYTQVTQVTDLSGTSMSVIPAAGAAGYCIQTQNAGTYLYSKNGGTYDQYTTASCASGNITSALAGSAYATGLTITITSPHNVDLLQIQHPAGAAILGKVNGAFMMGSFSPQGMSFGTRDFYNRSAIDTLTSAEGLPALP